MKHAKHTPGPWTAKIIAIPTDKIVGGERISVSAMTIVGPEDWVCRDRDLSEANARLIAAAPDLLDALERWAKIAKDDCLFSRGVPAEQQRKDCIHCATLAAIAKATGSSEGRGE